MKTAKTLSLVTLLAACSGKEPVAKLHYIDLNPVFVSFYESADDKYLEITKKNGNNGRYFDSDGDCQIDDAVWYPYRQIYDAQGEFKTYLRVANLSCVPGKVSKNKRREY